MRHCVRMRESFQRCVTLIYFIRIYNAYCVNCKNIASQNAAIIIDPTGRRSNRQRSVTRSELNQEECCRRAMSYVRHSEQMVIKTHRVRAFAVR